MSLQVFTSMFSDSVYGHLKGATNKPKKKCLLRDCKEMTSHNGGFCSAKHHKMYHAKERTK